MSLNPFVMIKMEIMNYSVFLICIFMYVMEANTYVLLQVRKKNDNYSNIDAIIHKVIPSGKFEEIAKNIAVKKQLVVDADNYEMRAKEDIKVRRNEERESGKLKKSTETATNEEANGVPVSLMETVEKTLMGLAKNYGKTEFRANANKYDIKTEVIHFRNDKPSLVFKLNSKTVMKAINDFLSSKIFAESIDNLTRKAAVAYRSLKNKEDA